MSKPDLESLLEQAADAFESGDLEAAQEAAERAVALDRRSAAAHHYLAAALLELGEIDEADREYHEALALAPDDLDLLADIDRLLLDHLGHDTDALEEALELARRGAALARHEDDPALGVGFAVTESRALVALGRPVEGLTRIEAVLAEHPDDLDARLQHGIALFELCRFEPAAQAFRQALALDRDEPLAHWYLGVIAERHGDTAEAARRLKRARKLDPEGFPEPIQLTEEAFDAVVEEALERLPERVRSYLENVAVACEAIPPLDDLLGSEPPLSPAILGVFRGAPLAEKQSADPWAHFPSSIVLYQRNLERACESREELMEQIEITVLHEVGHFLGLDEDDLRDWGLD